jgi:hypothetical protein
MCAACDILAGLGGREEGNHEASTLAPLLRNNVGALHMLPAEIRCFWNCMANASISPFWSALPVC